MKKYTSIDEYIKDASGLHKEFLIKTRALIKNLVPNATESISYGIPTFKLNGKNLVHYATFKDHVSFFPTSSPISVFKKELEDYKTSKGTIQFPLDKAIPYELIKKIVEFRVKEVSK